MNKIQKYFEYRKALIEQYLQGDMTKKEYLASNMDAISKVGILPFENVDSVEKALFNYQYFNAMAKQAKLLASGIKDKEKRYQLLQEANDYYRLKDHATYLVLKLIDYQNVRAYPVKAHSQYLKGKLIEIILEEHDMILHTLNSGIRNKLLEEGVFINEMQKSLIDGYINQKY